MYISTLCVQEVMLKCGCAHMSSSQAKGTKSTSFHMQSTVKLKQGYRYHKIRKAFSKFYHRHSELIIKYNIGLKTLLQQGISEPIFYGDLVS